MVDSTHHAARRLDLYACWMGDPLGRDRTIRRGFEDLRHNDIADSGLPLALAFGLTRYSVRNYRGPVVTTETVQTVFEQGIAIMKRVTALSPRLASAIERAAKGDEPASSPLADAMDAIAALAEDRSEIEEVEVEEVDDGIPDEYLGNPPGPPQDLMVVPPLDPKGGNSNTRDNRKSWVGIAGQRLPLVQTGDVAGIAADLSARWPHARDVIYTIMGDLSLGGPVRFRPSLLVGAPGSGKTALLRAIADACGLASEAYNMAGQGTHR